jgi:heat-inducible transcriptional repressor
MLDRELYLDGMGNIFDVPEWSDPFSARSVFDLVSNKNELLGLLSERTDDLEVTIGTENKDKNLAGKSLITATYHVDGKLMGRLGVIGPTRMQYNKVTSIIKYLTENIGDVFKI